MKRGMQAKAKKKKESWIQKPEKDLVQSTIVRNGTI